MDIKKYQVMLRAADSGSFAKAAQELMYTQSGITHMMNKLERELGFSVFLRTNSGVTLTEEGKNILPLIREIVNLNEQLDQEFALIQNAAYGNLKIAAFSSVAIRWIPAIMAKYRSLYPNVHVEMLEAGSVENMEEWLSEGRVDLCFYTPELRSSFDVIEIMDDPLLAILPLDHPLAKLDTVPVPRLLEEPFLIPNNYRDILKIFDEAGVYPKVAFTSNLDHPLIVMVEMGLGVSIMPELLISGREYRVAARPFSKPVTRKLSIAVRSLKGLSPVAKKFLECTPERFSAKWAFILNRDKLNGDWTGEAAPRASAMMRPLEAGPGSDGKLGAPPRPP